MVVMTTKVKCLSFWNSVVMTTKKEKDKEQDQKQEGATKAARTSDIGHQGEDVVNPTDSGNYTLPVANFKGS